MLGSLLFGRCGLGVGKRDGFGESQAESFRDSPVESERGEWLMSSLLGSAEG